MPIKATLDTITTYGTWLRGDRRGWVEDGVTYPPDPELEQCDRARLAHPPFVFAESDVPLRYGIGSIPKYMLIDPRGRIVYDGVDPESLQTAVRETLK